MLTEIAYGHRVRSIDDEIVTLADQASTETVRAGSPGSNILGVLVEFFPICAPLTIHRCATHADAYLLVASEALPALDARLRFQSEN